MRGSGEAIPAERVAEKALVWIGLLKGARKTVWAATLLQAIRDAIVATLHALPAGDGQRRAKKNEDRAGRRRKRGDRSSELACSGSENAARSCFVRSSGSFFGGSGRRRELDLRAGETEPIIGIVISRVADHNFR